MLKLPFIRKLPFGLRLVPAHGELNEMLNDKAGRVLLVSRMSTGISPPASLCDKSSIRFSLSNCKYIYRACPDKIFAVTCGRVHRAVCNGKFGIGIFLSSDILEPKDLFVCRNGGNKVTTFAFWNNKGGTGKTSLAFQALCRMAELNPDQLILAIDLCPQANLSELLLGGLVGSGGANLANLHALTPRKSVGGYFEKRMPAPFTMPAINIQDFISTPNDYNADIPPNVHLLAGDPIVELQANAIATLANTQIPGTDTWLAVIDWISDFMELTGDTYNQVFIDSNPSFSVYTQIALSTAEKLVLPVMADDSSRRAIQNMFSLIHGINVPAGTNYSPFSFPTKLTNSGRSLPLVHLIAKNRLTQYMGAASAYKSVLLSIDNDVKDAIDSHPRAFTFGRIEDGTVEIRDFQTTGVVAMAKGLPLSRLRPGSHTIMRRRTRVKEDYLVNCRDAIDDLVAKL